MPNVTVSTTALITPTRMAAVRNAFPPYYIQLFFFFFNLCNSGKWISSLSFKLDYRRAGLSCTLCCLLGKKASGLDCFIYFIPLWKQLLSSLKFLFFPQFKPQGVSVFSFSFWSANMQVCLIRIPKRHHSVHSQGRCHEASTQLNLIFSAFFFFFSLANLTQYFTLSHQTQLFFFPLCSLFNDRLWNQALQAEPHCRRTERWAGGVALAGQPSLPDQWAYLWCLHHLWYLAPFCFPLLCHQWPSVSRTLISNTHECIYCI